MPPRTIDRAVLAPIVVTPKRSNGHRPVGEGDGRPPQGYQVLKVFRDAFQAACEEDAPYWRGLWSIWTQNVSLIGVGRDRQGAICYIHRSPLFRTVSGLSAGALLDYAPVLGRFRGLKERAEQRAAAERAFYAQLAADDWTKLDHVTVWERYGFAFDRDLNLGVWERRILN